jgi:hypothetical protein
MPHNKKNPTPKPTEPTLRQTLLRPLRAAKGFWQKGIIQKLIVVLIAMVVGFVGVSYGVAQWYIASHKSKPLVYGATFSPYYAEYFGLDPKDTLNAIINDMGIKQLRLLSYWDESEATQGIYDFTNLDWQFAMAENSGAKVSLAIGLRQPRWPECHMPTWAKDMPMTEWEPKLTTYMQAVIDRYKTSPALESYQLENEFFLSVFGDCPDFTRERLVREAAFVKQADPTHPLIITRSNNALGVPIGDPRPDKFGVSVYKRVWDKTITKRYFEYPLPAWFYASLGGYGKIFTGKDLIIHELQTEAWLPDTGEFNMNDIDSIPEQNKSLDAARLKERLEYAKATGLREVYVWGIEWWYWQKSVGHPELWDTAKQQIQTP